MLQVYSGTIKLGLVLTNYWELLKNIYGKFMKLTAGKLFHAQKGYIVCRINTTCGGLIFLNIHFHGIYFPVYL